jgi:hypothetical protein
MWYVWLRAAKWGTRCKGSDSDRKVKYVAYVAMRVNREAKYRGRVETTTDKPAEALRS